MDKKLENRFYDLLSAKLSGDVTSEDLAELQAILEQNPQFQFLYNEVIRPSQTADDVTSHTQQAFASHYVKMMYANAPEKNKQNEGGVKASVIRLKQLKYIILAAACLLAAVIGITWFLNKDAKPLSDKFALNNNSKNEMVTPKGSKSGITLPDGTKVTLNADSKISYGEDFAKGKREVTLNGEAFFDVKHDAEHPFIIHTGKADIKVLGTAFNVRNYPNGRFETSLIRGKIEITLNDKSGKKIILNPSQKFIIPVDSTIAYGKALSHIKPNIYDTEVLPIIIKDSAVAEISWMSNKLIYVNKPLREIAEDLERLYDVNVVFKTAYSMNYRYTGTFENQGLEEILKILKLSKPFDYRLKNKELVIE